MYKHLPPFDDTTREFFLEKLNDHWNLWCMGNEDTPLGDAQAKDLHDRIGMKPIHTRWRCSIKESYAGNIHLKHSISICLSNHMTIANTGSVFTFQRYDSFKLFSNF